MKSNGLTLDAYKEVQDLIKEDLDKFKTWASELINKSKIELDMRQQIQKDYNAGLSNRLNHIESDMEKINTNIKNIEKILVDKKTQYKFKHDKRTAIWVCFGALVGTSLKEFILHPKLGDIFFSIISMLL